MDEELKARSWSCVYEVAGRLKTLDHVIVISKKELMPEGEVASTSSLWEPLSLSQGLPGICLLWGALDSIEPEDGWDQIGHNYAIAIQRILATHSIGDPGLWTGLSGICLSITSLSRGGTRYLKMLDQLHIALANLLTAELDQLEPMLHSQLAPNHYDIVSGIAGLTRYCLLHQQNKMIQPVLYRSLDYLEQMCTMAYNEKQLIPAWMIKPDHYLNPILKKTYPNGVYDMGMAHGIAGVLSAISIAHMTLPNRDNKRAATIRNVAEWLIEWVQQDEQGPYWPGQISIEQVRAGSSEALLSPPTRESWCYGTHGIARAIWFAGQAVDEYSWCELSIAATVASNNRMLAAPANQAPTYCHGLAGLLHMTNELAKDTHHPVLIDQRNQLVEKILLCFDTALPFGFCDMDSADLTNRPTQKAGLLDGAAGIALVLLSCLTNKKLVGSTAFLIR